MTPDSLRVLGLHVLCPLTSSPGIPEDAGALCPNALPRGIVPWVDPGSLQQLPSPEVALGALQCCVLRTGGDGIQPGTSAGVVVHVAHWGNLGL